MNELENIYNYLVDTIRIISNTDFGALFVLKGGSVLMSKLHECNRNDLGRLTRDIDIHCESKEVWINFCRNIENILNNNSFGYIYKLVGRRSTDIDLDASDSLKLILLDTRLNKEVHIKIDMNIKSNSIITCEYSIPLNMYTYDFYTSLSDKIVVVSSEKIYRRIKDLYDIAVIANISDLSYSNIAQHIRVKHTNAELKNMITQENISKIDHAYNAYKGISIKPDMNSLLSLASRFLQPFYVNYQGELLWYHNQLSWIEQ